MLEPAIIAVKSPGNYVISSLCCGENETPLTDRLWPLTPHGWAGVTLAKRQNAETVMVPPALSEARGVKGKFHFPAGCVDPAVAILWKLSAPTSLEELIYAHPGQISKRFCRVSP